MQSSIFARISKALATMSFPLILPVLVSSPSVAQSKGEVTSRPCPYSCSTAGIPRPHCRDWRQGNVCYVEDTRNKGKGRGQGGQWGRKEPVRDNHAPSGRAPAGKRGFVSARYCPHKCDTVGLPHSVCRDWREGDVCYVEDLTRAPGYSALPVGSPHSPHRRPENDWSDERWCREAGRHQISQPYVNIHSIKPKGGFFDGKYKVRGSIEGACLAEAGLYEDGRKRDDIRVATRRNFGRYEFEVDARRDRNSEIRVYNAAGEREIVEINPQDRYYDDRYRADGRYSRGNW